jgi:hypothetical protein
MPYKRIVNPLPKEPKEGALITTITVEVTKKDVLEGNFASATDCPLALALRRHFKTHMISSYFKFSLVGDVRYQHSSSYEHPEYLADVKEALKKSKRPTTVIRYVTIYRERRDVIIIP